MNEPYVDYDLSNDQYTVSEGNGDGTATTWAFPREVMALSDKDFAQYLEQLNLVRGVYKSSKAGKAQIE